MAEAAASVIGIIDFGLKACQGLYTYYHAYKSFDSSVSSAYDSIAQVARTLILLKDSCNDPNLDLERRHRVAACVHSCEDALKKSNDKLQQLRIADPEGFREKVRARYKRHAFPFKEQLLNELCTAAGEAQSRLALAIQILDLAERLKSQRVLDYLETWSCGVTITIDQLSEDTQRLLSIARSDKVDNILCWLSPPDPWTNHNAARGLHQAGTGRWVLDNDTYKAWLSGATRHLWLYGKAGCGKTILSSTIVDNVQHHCRQAANFGFAPFYFTFSDQGKQSYEALLRSLVAQLGTQEPGLSIIQERYDQRHKFQGGLNVQNLEAFFLAVVAVYDTVFVVLDALDECPEESDARSKLFEGLNHLAKEADNLQILMTSRDESDIRDCMLGLPAKQMQIQTRAVDTDIHSYVAQQLSQGQYFRRLKRESLDLIQATITEKSDGMFRWAYCQLQELSQNGSTRPSRVKDALKSLPKTLDETYARMLERIRPADRGDALTLLRWLAHSVRPMKLAELQTAVIIRPENDEVDFEDEGDFRDALNILAGLVVFSDDADSTETVDWTAESFYADSSDDAEELDYTKDDKAMAETRELTPATRIRLAHFSVKEYLESTRISGSSASAFRLEARGCHRFLSQSCLTYLKSYSRSDEKTSPRLDLKKFHLLKYAANQWCEHSRLRRGDDVSREVALLECKDARLHWLRIEELQRGYSDCLETQSCEILPSIYYAVDRCLPHVLKELLEAGQDANSVGPYNVPLLVNATGMGFREPDLAMVDLLLTHGADANAISRGYKVRSALGYAVAHGLPLTKLLVDSGADVNISDDYGTVLTWACVNGNLSTVEFLLEKGARVDTADSSGYTALATASFHGHTRIVELLIAKGANVNRPSTSLKPLLVAAESGRTDIVAMLIDAGADINAVGVDGVALSVALHHGHEHTAALLEARGAKKLLQEQLHEILISICGDTYRRDFEGAFKLLLDRGADVNARDSGALVAVLEEGNERWVALVEAAGAHQLTLEQLNNTLIRVCCDLQSGVNVVLAIDMLLERGADINARDSGALAAALEHGNELAVVSLEAKGANKLTSEQLNGTLIRACQCREDQHGYKSRSAIGLLLDRGADVNTEDSSPLLGALLTCDEEWISELEKRGAKSPPLERLNDALIELCKEPDPDPWRFEMLLDRGADINAGTKGS